MMDAVRIRDRDSSSENLSAAESAASAVGGAPMRRGSQGSMVGQVQARPLGFESTLVSKVST